MHDPCWYQRAGICAGDFICLPLVALSQETFGNMRAFVSLKPVFVNSIGNSGLSKNLGIKASPKGSTIENAIKHCEYRRYQSNKNKFARRY